MIVFLVTVMTVLGMVAPVAGVAASDPTVVSDAPDDAVPSTAGEESDYLEETTTDSYSTDQTNSAKISETLHKQLESADDGDRIPVIVIFEKRPDDQFDLQGLDESTAQSKLQSLAASQQSAAKSYLRKQQERNRAGEVQSLWSTNSMAVRATGDTIEGLAGLPKVERIVYDQKVQKADGESGPFADLISKYGNSTVTSTGFEESTTSDPAWSPEYIGADAVKERGVKGNGVNVSVVDTGIDAQHPALAGAVTKWKDFTPDNETKPVDPDGHGTHVAGTIAARPAGERAVGVAPEANLFGAKVFSSEEPARVSDIVRAFEWSANNSADIVSASIGVPPHIDEYAGDTTLGDDAQAANNVRIYANASGSTSGNLSTDAYKPAYVLISVEPVEVNGTQIQNETHRAAIMSNMSVSLADPSGKESLRGVELSWVFENGEVPDQITLRKYKPTGSEPLTQDGNWTLSVESQTGKNVTYSYSAVPVYPSNGSDEVAESINTITNTHDLNTVIAAGNYAGDFGNRSLSSPGVAKEAITVGAAGDRTNDVAVFSSRGPVGYGPNERPGVDVIAPGADIVSTVPTDTSPDTDANYGYSSGTSMAAPHVSGTLALMLSADPSRSPDELESTLEATAQESPAGENAAGAGVIDAYRAVNATNASALGPETAEDGRHTLFAGLGNTSDRSAGVRVSPHMDTEGDAGSAPDIWATTKLVTKRFQLATYDDTAPNATFRMYIDADRNDLTGDGGQQGAEFMIEMNRTYDGAAYDLMERTYAYNVSTDVYEPTDAVTIYSDDATAQLVELSEISFANRSDAKPFDWHVTSAERGASPGDRFPNERQVTNGIAQDISGTAVAWNATTGAPDSGVPVSFRVYNESGAIVANETVESGPDGQARSSLPVRLTNPYGGNYVLEITDTYGNEIRQNLWVDDSCIEDCLLEDDQNGLGYTVVTRRYEFERNETVTLNVPVYNASDGNMTEYAGDASLALYNYDTDERIVVDNITVDDGVVRTQIDFGAETIDDTGTYLSFRVALNGDFRNASTSVSAGSINFATSETETTLTPPATMVGPDEAARFTFQSATADGEPKNVSVDYTVYWLTERHVASLYEELSPDLVDRIKAQKYGTSAESTQPLTAGEREQVRLAVQNLSEQGLHIETTRGSAPPVEKGVGELSVTPPDDAVYGVIGARPNGTEEFTTGATVTVDDRLRDYRDQQTEPREDDRYELRVYTDWDSTRENGTVVPEDSYNVSVGLYDWENREYVDNVSVKLYSTFGQNLTVDTGPSGFTELTLPAPDRDWENVSYDFRDQEVLGVADGYTTADGEPVSQRDTMYGTVFDLSEDSVEPIPEATYTGDGTIETRIEYRDQRWELQDGNKTLFIVERGSSYTSTGDVHVGYIDPDGNATTVNVTDTNPPGTDEPRSYRVNTRMADMEYESIDQLSVPGLSVQVDAPDEIVDGQPTSVTVTVTDRNGDPVENAVVNWKYLLFSPNQDISGESNIPTEIDGAARIAVTDSNGQATVEVSPEIDDNASSRSLSYQVGIASENRSVALADEGSILVIQQQGNVSGRIVYPNGSTVANDTVAAFGYGTYDRTNESGSFSVPVGDGSSDVAFYQTADDGEAGPLDGVPDVYAIGEVDGATDLGNVTLPEAHRLNVTVIDEDGDPVENARVGVAHTQNDAVSGGVLETNAAGELEIDNRTGIEVVDNVSLRITPPDGETRFVTQNVTRNLTVTADDEVTVTLEERPQVEGQIVYPDNSTVADDLVVGWGWNQLVRTTSDGQFEVAVGDGPGEVGFAQAHENFTGGETDGDPGPIDGVPDLYAIGTFDNATDLGNVTLPEPHRVNVTVVTDNGTPVRDAIVRVGHTQDGATIGWGSRTNADGEFTVTGRVGAELVGNVTVEVDPPENATAFENETVTRNLTVNSDENVTVSLNSSNPSTAIEVAPEESNTSVGGTTTYTVVVTNATDGVGAYEANVSVANASVGEITAVELLGDPGVSNVTVAADNASVQFSGAIADTNDTGRVGVARVTVRAMNPGETGVTTAVDAVGTESGVGYTITATTGTTLNVSDIGKLRDSYDGAPNDVDGDGVYEDINGDGNFTIADVQALYTVYEDDVVKNNPDVFDINGENGVNIVDVQALYIEYQEADDE